ncbi:Zn(2)-C6 fungal-type domain-containing protein [Favolaschia claudopus]|uniref:Zn(2)-C6 fungal-type domain-containing protein n=1 Tax=Favolaschia claudopus TaxID=2862362 RepID=A0AAW0CVA0_9AGAR
MSSGEDSLEPERVVAKQKRVQRACDMCRRKKRDGGERCEHCTKHDFVCTYIEPSSIPSHPGTQESSATPISKSYIQSLEARVKTVEALLEKAKSERSPGVQLISNAIRRLNSPFPTPHADDLAYADIAESFRALQIDHPAGQGFQGKSSGAMLVKAAVDLHKNATAGKRKNKAADTDALNLDTVNRQESIPPLWDVPTPLMVATQYTFPPTDLLRNLVSLFFERVNPFIPLLHRPTFENAAFTEHLHLTNVEFAKTLLLACAVGARYSGDSRVLAEDAPEVGSETAGWKYFDQVKLSGHRVRTHPKLYDLQCYCLAAMFLDCTSSPRTCWTLVGFGMRLGQDIGSHRYKMQQKVTFENELEKRASWVLYLFDAQISASLGRCIALQSHDFDIELPIICDDEHWSSSAPTNAGEVPTPLFCQPAEKPSRIAYFNCMLGLSRILSFSCKILYSTNRSKTLIGLGDDKWEEQVVVELDSALNTWFETVPTHLRWDPNNLIQDDVFFDQSAVLYCAYYHTRIIIHRPFIPAMRRASNPTHLPSLAICNTAARACSHVAQVQQERRPNNPLWFSQTPLFTSGIVLLLNIWGGSGKMQAEKDLADVHRCMAVLDAQRAQWPSAGALLDTLKQLVAVDHPQSVLPDPQMATHTMFDVPPHPQAISFDDGSIAIQRQQPFSSVLTPPMYDPALETAPPDYLADEEWLGADPSTSTMNINDGLSAGGFPSQMYLDPMIPIPMGYGAGGGGDVGSIPGPTYDFSDVQGFSGGAYGLGLDQDFNMDVDPNTIALWSQAPTSFGVADWDIYLGRFVDEVQAMPNQGNEETHMFPPF